MVKQVLKAAIVIAVLLTVASPAWAGSINVILDDPTVGGGPLAYFLPYGSNSPYSMTWQSCGGYPTTGPVPPNEPAAGYLNCLAIVNNTGTAITDLILSIPDSSADTFLCSVSGFTTGFSCSASSSGGIETLEFTGIPGFLNNTEIYIGVGCAASNPAVGCTDTGTQNVSGLGNPTVLVPTYDPSTLVLLMAGMSMLAMASIRRYA